MAAKEVKFGDSARARMVEGINVLADAVKVDGQEVLVMREEDIMGVLQA